MPDLFHGDPAPNSRTAASPAKAGELASPSLLDTFKIKAAETAKSFLIDMWLARHTEEKVMPILHKVLDASKEEFADAVANGGGVYAVGYCFGGRYVLLLGSEKPAPEAARASPPVAAETEEATPAMQSAEPARQRTASGPLIKAGAVAHPTLVSRDDFQHLKAPTTLACVEDDPMFPDEMRKAVEDHLQKTNVQHEVQVYPGVPHGKSSLYPNTLQYAQHRASALLIFHPGFAVVGEYEDEKIISAQLTAHEQMLKWLKEH
jgi:dienelactone hydrolase